MKQHVMKLQVTFPTGAMLWTCPDCGYSFVTSPVEKHLITLNYGDETVTHSGAVGGVNVHAAPNETGLEVFEQFLKDTGLLDEQE